MGQRVAEDPQSTVWHPRQARFSRLLPAIQPPQLPALLAGELPEAVAWVPASSAPAQHPGRRWEAASRVQGARPSGKA